MPTSIAGERVCTYLLGGDAPMSATSCKRKHRYGFTLPGRPAATARRGRVQLHQTRRPDATQFASTGDNPRSDGGATVAPPSGANEKTLVQAAPIATGRNSQTRLERIGELQRLAAGSDRPAAGKDRAMAGGVPVHPSAGKSPDHTVPPRWRHRRPLPDHDHSHASSLAQTR